MNIIHIYLGPIIQSGGGMEKVYCNYATYFHQKYNTFNIINDSTEGTPLYSLEINKKIFKGEGVKEPINETPIKLFNLKLNKYNIHLPLTIKLKHLITHNFRRFFNPRETYFRKLIAKEIDSIISVDDIDIAICYGLPEYFTILETGLSPKKVILMFHHSEIDTTLSNLTSNKLQLVKEVGAIQILQQDFLNQVESIDSNKIHIIGNIVPQHSIQTDYSQKKIISLGRLDKYAKRQHLLIEAFAKISDKFPDWHIDIIGDNSIPKTYKQELEELIIKYNLEDRVHLLGLRSDIDNLLKTGSIFAFTTRREGFSLALAEAMSMGLPVIAFDNIIGVRSMVKDNNNGLLAKDINDFSNKLALLMENITLRAHLGLNAKRSIEPYSTDLIFSKWDELINTVYLSNKK